MPSRTPTLRMAASFCSVCGRPTVVVALERNLRETLNCVLCFAKNRQRQLARVITRSIDGKQSRPSLRLLRRKRDLAVYNTEARGPIHRMLHGMPRYECSQYLGPLLAPGVSVRGVRHEDIQNLSFDNEAFDLVISSDVLEHVPDPHAAHRELFRILRPGGRHVFTVPYSPQRQHSRSRATLRPDGRIQHLESPEYHRDPAHRPRGILVFTDYGLDMCAMIDAVGFQTTRYLVRDPSVRTDSAAVWVFESVKPTDGF